MLSRYFIYLYRVNWPWLLKKKLHNKFYIQLQPRRSKFDFLKKRLWAVYDRSTRLQCDYTIQLCQVNENFMPSIRRLFTLATHIRYIFAFKKNEKIAYLFHIECNREIYLGYQSGKSQLQLQWTKEWKLVFAKHNPKLIWFPHFVWS